MGRGGWFAVSGWQVGEKEQEEIEQGGGFAGGRGGGDGVVHHSQGEVFFQVDHGLLGLGVEYGVGVGTGWLLFCHGEERGRGVV